MKSMRSMIFAGLALVAFYCVVRLVLPGHPAAPAEPLSRAVPRESRPARPRQTARPAEAPLATGPSRQRSWADERSVSTPGPEATKAEAPSDTPPAAPANTSGKNAASASGKAPKTAGAAPAQRSSKPPIQDQMARAALAYVGADPDAEAYWYEAINDPGLGPQERQDLIEDLNEDGLSDPHNPTVDDLPLILSRIQLIEEVVWDAMDEVNADAFMEAYKDLVNLAYQAMGNG